MSKIRVKIGPKGQIIIPEQLRKKIGIIPGMTVNIDIDNSNDSIIIVKENLELNDETVKDIKQARKEIKDGKTFTHSDLLDQLES